MSWTDKMSAAAILAALGVGAYFLLKYTKPTQQGTVSCCTEMTGLPKFLCEIGEFSTGAQCKPDDKGKPIVNIGGDSPMPVTYDKYGCRTDIQRWCDIRKTCLDIALPCASIASIAAPGTPGDPYKRTPAPVVQNWRECKGGTYNSILDICVGDPNDWPGKVVGVNKICTAPSGAIQSAPVTKNCKDVIADMCERFGPGSKWC